MGIYFDKFWLIGSWCSVDDWYGGVYKYDLFIIDKGCYF